MDSTSACGFFMITRLFQWVGVATLSCALFATVALSKPATQTTQSSATPDVLPSVVRSAAVDEPVCYFQTTNRQTIDLSVLCGDSTRVTPLQATYPQPPRVYDQDAVKAFDDSVYGSDN